jgi:hypothetical protein
MTPSAPATPASPADRGPHPLDRSGQGTSSDDMNTLGTALVETAMVRLGLEALWSNLPPDFETDAVRGALWHIHERLCATEIASLREHGMTRRYLLIIPISPLNPPPPAALAQITAAIRTLDDHGLLIGHGPTD